MDGCAASAACAEAMAVHIDIAQGGGGQRQEHLDHHEARGQPVGAGAQAQAARFDAGMAQAAGRAAVGLARAQFQVAGGQQEGPNMVTESKYTSPCPV